MRIIKGPVPPSVLCPPISKKADEASVQGKVKRKCGRPRNPIPRHKRESHINAEHRRRGKIQDGFRTLKNMVPRYEQTSGRDSKADILFKAVDYCKLLQHDIKEMTATLESLRAEREVLSADIKNYKTLVPDIATYEHVTTSMDDRYTEYVHQRTKEHWAFGTFKVIMRPLFESYKLSVSGETLAEFLRSVTDWASNSLCLSNLRAVCLTTLRDEGCGQTGSHKERQLLEIRHFGSAAPMAHTLPSDSNNNTSINNKNIQCLASYSQTPAHSDKLLTSRPEVDSSSAANSGDICTPAFHQAKIIRCGPSMNMHHHPTTASFTGNSINSASTDHIGSGIFSDLYFNVDHDLHYQNHLGFTSSSSTSSTTMDAFDHWQHHRFQQPHQYYQFDHFLPSGQLRDLKKGHPFWSGQVHPLMQDTTGVFSASHSVCSHVHPLCDRAVKYDLPNSRDPPLGISPPAPPVSLGHPSNSLDPDHCRHKRLSQSSSESDNSVLNMGTFARQAVETLGEHDKQTQLPPSTCSPSQNTDVYNMNGCNGRRGEGDSFYHRASSLEHYMQQHRPPVQDRAHNPHSDNTLPNRLSVSLPSYRETFGGRRADHHITSGSSLEESTDDHVQFKHFGQTQSGNRFESSSLLAELLGQHSAGHPDQYLHTHPHTDLAAQAGRTSNISSNHNSSVSPAYTGPPCNDHLAFCASSVPSQQVQAVKQEESNNKSEKHFLTESSGLVKPSEDMWMAPSPVPTSQPTTSLSITPSSLCSPRRHYDLLTPNSDSSSQVAESSPGTSEDTKTWTLAGGYKPTKCAEDPGWPTSARAQDQVCYFELAHQQMLKSQSLSHGPSPDITQSSDVPATPTAVYKTSSKTVALTSNQQPEGNITPPPSPQTVMAATFSSGQSSPPCLPLPTVPGSGETTLKSRIGRKSSFEESFPRDQNTEAGECKRSCQWLRLSSFKGHCGQEGRTDVKGMNSPVSGVTECVHKSDIGALGETTLRFL